ncbi:MAG: DUF1156 domain-containing protein [Selenomonas sp.]|uniref:DUF1156 domain-containing protein n=1 Tax=Selenomonas sp. TaxID=2053611 RepID=UPI0025E23044|nr:DUF1156 domain-containing protein [Selenomonas sp.]MCI6231066.1 DUF1156 domain-containing protein [Selenomonas sp.]
MADIKKLIEVAIPLDDINAASAREKSIRHGHPSTLHLWWSRKPLATARAVLFASLVDAPSSHPELFPTEAEQEAERQRLFDIIRELVKWENVNNEEVLEQARAEIRRWNDEMPTLLDPFAGGGSIPLEAQRLGLKAIAADLNPVAVMINKAMIEIPPLFKDLPPVNPKDRETFGADADYHGAQGIAKDIHYYGELLKQKAYEKIGGLYPKVKDPETGEERTVIAWIWARTVKCPNPACGCEMPLVNSFWLSKKKGNETYIDPIVDGNHIIFDIKHGLGQAHNATVNRTGARCICCKTEISLSRIKEESKQNHMGKRLLAIVAEGDHKRVYFPANQEHEIKAKISRNKINYPDGNVAYDPRNFSVKGYGIEYFSQLFTTRQLALLTTIQEIIPEIGKCVLEDAKQYFSEDMSCLQDKGTGARAYSESIIVYLTFLLDKIVDYHSSLCGWTSAREVIRDTFGRQSVSMTWNFAEANPFSHSSGCFDNMLEWVENAVAALPCDIEGDAFQQNVTSDNEFHDFLISTDPPYYDNISYADISDFFYIWMRHTLLLVYPKIFGTMETPKADELVMNPYRMGIGGSKEENVLRAKSFFENRMSKTCKLLKKYTKTNLPVTIYYAFKQNDIEDENGKASSGWETMLSAIIRSGLTITGTWPVRTERKGRVNSIKTNALASSIVLVCRKRSKTIGNCSRKDFIRKLRRELTSAIAKLQSANIAPVDMMQSAIGPGISVYSRYEHVLEADGTEMSVRTALQLINQELDTFFGGQSEGLDAETRFAIELYTQQGYGEMAFGTADVLARAMNTSVAHIAETGCILSGKGIVRLTKREELPAMKKSWSNEPSWMRLQRLAHAMEREGIRGCAELLMNAVGGQDELKHLAYRMYQIAEDRSESSEASVYNNLVISWEDIIARANEMRAAQPQETELAFGEEDHHA